MNNTMQISCLLVGNQDCFCWAVILPHLVFYLFLLAWCAVHFSLDLVLHSWCVCLMLMGSFLFLLEQNVYSITFWVLMITRYYKLSVGYANICSSVQDHRQKFNVFISSICSGRTNESNGSYKMEAWVTR